MHCVDGNKEGTRQTRCTTNGRNTFTTCRPKVQSDRVCRHKKMWTATLAILDIRADPSLTEPSFDQTTRYLSVKKVTTARFRLTDSAPVKVMGTVTTEKMMRQRCRKNGFLVASRLTKNFMLKTELVGKHIERGRKKANPIIPSSFSLASTANGRRRAQIMTIFLKNDTQENGIPTDIDTCVVTRITNLFPVSEKMAQVKTFCERFQFVKRQKILIFRRVTLAAQVIVDMVVGLRFLIKNCQLVLVMH